MMLLTNQPQHVGSALTPRTLRIENQRFQNTGGVSRNNRDQCFRPAFLDSATGRVYLSRFADGRLAPMHLMDGLPDEIVRQRNAEGRITAVTQTVIAGFARDGLFYTREQAAKAVASATVTPARHS